MKTAILALAAALLVAPYGGAPARAGPEPWRLQTALDMPDWLRVSGSQRTRYSSLANQFRPGIPGSDQAVSLRFLLKAEIGTGPVSFVAEFQDARTYLSDLGGALSTIEVNAVSLLQGHMALRLRDLVQDGDRLSVRIGRQTLDIGGRRLIARNRFRNTIQNYTGLVADWTGQDDLKLRAFYVLPVRVRPDALGDLIDNQIVFDEEDVDFRLWGVHASAPLEALGARAELYVFGLNDEDDPNERATRDRTLYTPGLRLHRQPAAGQVDFDVETVLQFGTRRATTSPLDTQDLSVFAHFHHVTVGYSLDHPWRPRISLEFDFGSGESDPGDGRATRFDSLFGPRRAEFGPTGLYGLMGRENTISGGVRLGLAPSSRLDGFVSWRANGLDEATDSFSRSGVRDPLGASGRFAGHQFETRARYWVVPDAVRFELGGAAFFNGRFLESAPNANGAGDPLYGYADLTFAF